MPGLQSAQEMRAQTFQLNSWKIRPVMIQVFTVVHLSGRQALYTILDIVIQGAFHAQKFRDLWWHGVVLFLA